VSNIAAIILAAGESSRFGKPKQLLEFEGKTLLRRVVDAASAANCSPIVVVIGGNEVQARAESELTDAVVVKNEHWKHGIGTSIRTGVQHLIDTGASVDAIVILVCDQPFVDAALIKQLIALHAKTRKAIVASGYADTLGVPAIFDRSCFSELLALADSRGAKSVIVVNKQRIAELPFPKGNIDIDTMKGWKKFEVLLRSA
jgi:molybdenum cofactor cytidylyltransferase